MKKDDLETKFRGLVITNSNYATPLKRLLSFLIDTVFIIAVSTTIIKGLNYFKVIDGDAIEQEVVLKNDGGTEIAGLEINSKNFKIIRWVSLGTSLIYFVLFLSSKKQATIGNQIMKIMVVNIKRNRVGIMDAALRYIAMLLNNTFFFAGYLLYFFRDDRAFLQDILSDTRVINLE